MDTTTYRYHIVEESVDFLNKHEKMDIMTYRYHIVEEYVFNPEIGRYRTYGIELIASDGTTDYISDISVCKMDIERMVADFNRYQLSPVHFQEAVEDML